MWYLLYRFTTSARVLRWSARSTRRVFWWIIALLWWIPIISDGFQNRRLYQMQEEN